MKSVLCLFATFAIMATATADDVPGPVLEPVVEDPYLAPRMYGPAPAPVYGPLPYAGGNSFHIFSGPAIDDGFSSAGYYGGGPVFESYHAGSYHLPADLPYAGYPYQTGAYGPMMLDVLVVPDMSRRYGRPHHRW